MKRSIMAVFAASALFVAGCANSSEQATETAPETTSATQVEAAYAEVGDTIPVDCVTGKCVGELQVEEIVLGGECKEVLVGEEVPDGMQLLQVSGILTATEKVDDGQGGEVGAFVEVPEAWDGEKFKTIAEWGGGCDIPQGYEQWGVVPAKTGEKVRVYGTFLVTDAAKELGIANSKFDVSNLPPATTASSAASVSAERNAPNNSGSSASATSAQNVATDAPAGGNEDPVIGYTEAPGEVVPQVMEKQIASCGDPSIHETGTTFFTDGTSGWTANCASQMM